MELSHISEHLVNQGDKLYCKLEITWVWKIVLHMENVKAESWPFFFFFPGLQAKAPLISDVPKATALPACHNSI